MEFGRVSKMGCRVTTIADDGAGQNLLRGRLGRRYMICATAMVASALVLANVPGAATTPARFGLFAQTELPLSSIVWTGRDWLYASETVGRFALSDAQGRNDVEIAKISQGGEETRCDVAPGKAGFTAGDLYCHLPDNRIIHLERDGWIALERRHFVRPPRRWEHAADRWLSRAWRRRQPHHRAGSLRRGLSLD